MNTSIPLPHGPDQVNNISLSYLCRKGLDQKSEVKRITAYPTLRTLKDMQIGKLAEKNSKNLESCHANIEKHSKTLSQV